MRPTMRPYAGGDDEWRVRAFLRAAYLAHGRRTLSWPVARFDYTRWHVALNVAEVRLEDVAFVWEADGEIVALLLPDGGPREAHLSVHPRWRSPALEAEMLDVAEDRLHAVRDDGTRRLLVWAAADDLDRQALLAGRGYARTDVAERVWRRRLAAPVEVVPPAAGYTVRSLGDGLELLERCYASGLGFHDGDVRQAAENRDDPTWYRNIQTAPLYRRDLDLVAVSPDGAIGAFATFWFDDVTRSALVEPVATVPAHRRLGLARAVLTEGLRRVQRMGADLAQVSGYGEAANALYRSVMSDDHDVVEAWSRDW